LPIQIVDTTLAASMKSEKFAKQYRISGRVQGVGFRYFAERAARNAGVLGYVRNCSDGSVEVYAVGSPTALEILKHHLEQGPPGAQIKAVEEQDAAVKAQYKTFSIEGGW
jgi:acylphosphatase